MSERALPAPRVHVAVGPEPIDVVQLTAAVADPSAGATTVFLGTVRDHARGKTGVTHLEYEVYGELVVDKITEVVGEALEKWPVAAIAAVHRTGRLDVGETSVGVAASSPHRPDAFAAARYVIDELKRRAPIWKKEHWEGGSEWVREDTQHH